MRKSLLLSAALLGLTAGPVLAQSGTSSTMSPPSPNASAGSPQPTNSIPSGAGTATRVTPGDNVGTTRVGPGAAVDPGMSGIRPMRGQQRYTGRTPRPPMGDSAAEAPATGEYRGGAGSPSSSSASNTTAANTRSEIAPRLPDPASTSNTPQAYLAAAQRALASGRTGAAQEALERAETRVLSRSIDPAMASSPDASPMVTQIGNARRALASRDTAAARAAISAAISSGG